VTKLSPTHAGRVRQPNVVGLIGSADTDSRPAADLIATPLRSAPQAGTARKACRYSQDSCADWDYDIVAH
jgi:hypothetical protein